jgi:hypothetical protein
MSKLATRTSVTRAAALTLLLMLVAGPLGCSTGSAPDTAAPQLRLRPTLPAPVAPPADKSALRLRLQPQVPAEARQFLGSFSAPSLPASAGSGKGVSVNLPTGFAGDQAYPAGPGDEQGYLASHNVSFPGPPFGGADMAPTGPDYPDNISWIIYRIDDIVGQEPGTLTIQMGLTLPGTQVGVAPYNWAYGSNGVWQPLYFEDPNNTGGQIQIELFGFPGEDFTNANDDLAFLVFCLHPGGTSVNTVQLEEAVVVPPDYDEVEDNDDPASASVLPPFNFGGFTGNVGLGGPHDDTFDIYTFTATTGDTVDFTVNYDPAADYDGSAAGVIGGFVDQEYFDTLGVSGLSVITPGAGGVLQVSYTLDGSEQLPIYFAVQNLNEAPSAVPATDYTISATGPGGGTYDEVEPNQTDLEANPLPAFPFIGWSGNIGELGVYDGTLYDAFSFTAAPGSTVNFTLTYDPASEDVNGDGTGVALFLIDQQYWVDFDEQYLAGYSSQGTAGSMTVNHPLDPTWAGPFYVVPQLDNTASLFPATDYTLDGSL